MFKNYKSRNSIFQLSRPSTTAECQDKFSWLHKKKNPQYGEMKRRKEGRKYFFIFYIEMILTGDDV